MVGAPMRGVKTRPGDQKLNWDLACACWRSCLQAGTRVQGLRRAAKAGQTHPRKAKGRYRKFNEQQKYIK